MTNAAPVNVLLESPSVPVDDWTDQAKQWKLINKDIGGHPGFFPLTIKGAYVIGTAHTICQSVEVLMQAKGKVLSTYLPAYGVFASAVELLGRCLNGNESTRGSSSDLVAGFSWVASTKFDSHRSDYTSVPLTLVLVQTIQYMYSIDNLVALRHFAAHGQATGEEMRAGGYRFGYVDIEILSHMPSLIGAAYGKFWAELQSSEDLCNRLAKASIIALRKWPVMQSWSLFEKDSSGHYGSIFDIFNQFDWAARE